MKARHATFIEAGVRMRGKVVAVREYRHKTFGLRKALTLETPDGRRWERSESSVTFRGEAEASE